MKKKFYIITGMSGAGKSQGLKILEDMGFFCIDNMPVPLVLKFADLYLESKGKWGKVAIGIDIRAGQESLEDLEKILCQISKKGIEYKIIYFNANDASLIKRYSETRRRHPLGKRILDGITKERKLLSSILTLADKELDTSDLTLGELKEIIAKEMNVSPDKTLNISLESFGYKYGMPADADLVIDVRFLPNPNYIMNMRYKTGKDNKVRNFVMRQKPSKEFFKRFFQLLEFLIPLYVREGKSYLTIAIGCTGGRHRSVVVTEATALFLKHKKYRVEIFHRDIERVKAK